jgi:hypothetical protein
MPNKTFTIQKQDVSVSQNPLNQKKDFVITKRIAKHGNQAIIVIPKILENKESQSQQAAGYSLSLKLENESRTKVRGIAPSLSNQLKPGTIAEIRINILDGDKHGK